MPQKFRWRRIVRDRRLPVSRECGSWPDEDVVALARRQRRCFAGRLVEQQPQRDPGQAEHAGEHERELPAVRQNRPRHERRRQHRAQRRAHVEEAAGQPALGRGKPFRRRLHAGRIRRPFRETEQRAQPEQRLPAAGQAVRHADERPRDREDREPELQPDGVHDVAADRLQHDRELEGAEDPRVLLRADVQVFQDGRRGHRQRAARQVVDDRAHHQQAHHPPAQSPESGHWKPGLQTRVRSPDRNVLRTRTSRRAATRASAIVWC